MRSRLFRCSENRAFRGFVSLVMAALLVISGFSILPQESYADDTSASANLGEIWVVPEVISGARQPASGGMFAWVTFDYSYQGYDLAGDLDPADFTLQMKTQHGEWQDVPGNNIAVLGGDEYYIAYFEAIVAARVPDNTDPFIKKWRISYEPDGAAEPLVSEIIVQAAALDETDDVTAFNKEYCADFKVEQAPWSYAEYQNDHIPPVYIAYVYPDVVTSFNDPGLVKPEGTSHSIVLPNIGVWDYGNGAGFGHEDLQTMETDLRLGDTEEDNAGIAGLVDFWNQVKSGEFYFDWPESSSAPLPDAQALYRKLSSLACVPDENADEYLSYVVDGTNVFWITGAGPEEAVSNGVTDYILVVVRDLEAYGTSSHDWSNAPAWEWKGNDSTGYTAATATFTCANHSGHVSKAPAVVRSTDDGEEITYTATATFMGKKYKDVRKVAITEEEEEPLPSPPPAPSASQGSGQAAGQQSKAAAAPGQSLTVNQTAVTRKTIQMALQTAQSQQGTKASIDTLVIGKGVKKISKGALKGSGVKTLVVKSKKLKKKTVKGALKGSSVKTVKVKVGSKKVNKKYVKKYKKIFTKKNAGKKVRVK